MDREKELLQIVLEMRELARFQTKLAAQGAEALVDWETLDTKLSATLLKFGVVEEEI